MVIPVWHRWIILLLFQTNSLLWQSCLHCYPQMNEFSPSDVSNLELLLKKPLGWEVKWSTSSSAYFFIKISPLQWALYKIEEIEYSRTFQRLPVSDQHKDTEALLHCLQFVMAPSKTIWHGSISTESIKFLQLFLHANQKCTLEMVDAMQLMCDCLLMGW